MYNDSIDVSNKIITYNDLIEIFSKMYEKFEYYKKIYNNEELQNRVLDYNYQNWTFKDAGSVLTFDVDFYDNSNIKFDKYENFIGVFNNRLHEIKYIHVNFHLMYSIKESEQNLGHSDNFYSQRINIMITENKMEFEFSLNSSDKKIDDIYELIKNKIQKAPSKYSFVIAKKSTITVVIAFALGFIPVNIILFLLCILIRDIKVFFDSFVLWYPICSLILTYFIGNIIANNMLDDLYKNIVPEKVYSGYNSNTGNSIYKDDIDNYTKKSEILIGKNINNLKCRKEIRKKYEKYKKYIPYEIIVLVILTIIIWVL